MTPEYGSASQLEKIDMLDFRRRSGDQQVRPARGGGRAPGRVQADAAQPSRLRRRARHDAGVRHHRLTLQRRRRHRLLPEPPAHGARAVFAGVAGRRPARGERAHLDPGLGHRARPSGALPRGGGRELCAATVGGWNRRCGSARERQSLRETQAMLEAASKGRVDAIDALLEERPLDATMRRPSSTSGRRSRRRTGKTSW